MWLDEKGGTALLFGIAGDRLRAPRAACWHRTET